MCSSRAALAATANATAPWIMYGIERRAKISALDVFQRVGEALDIAHVGDRRPPRPARSEPSATTVFTTHQARTR